MAWLALILLSPVSALSQVADEDARRSDPAVWRELEHEVFAEINHLRSDPAGYAERVLLPLQQTMTRYPEDASLPFQGMRLVFDPAHRDDYVLVKEGGTAEAAAAVLDEALAAVNAAPRMAALTRDPVLDQAARFNSHEFAVADSQRTPHVDSLGRRPAARLAAFGHTQRMREDWATFVAGLNARAERLVRVCEEDGIYYLVELPAGGGYRCRSVPERFARFIAERGQAVMLPELDQAGHQCLVRVDRSTRKLYFGTDSIDYPMRLPITGENVVWGAWSRRTAARGLVAWWVLDPGILDRGHRRILLDNDFRYCGVGCAWSAARGWVATFDASSEPWEAADSGSGQEN